jgi:hypothetical protein
MKVLIIVDQFTKLESTGYYHFIRTFNNAFENDTDYQLETRFICQEDIWSPEYLTKVLLESDFDIAIVSPIWHVHVQIKAAKKLGKKLFICIWDSHSQIITSNRDTNFRIFCKSKPVCGHTFVHTLAEYSQYCNILVVDYGYEEIMPNIYGIPSVQDSKILYPTNENEKKYELLFFGSMSTSERKYFINNIKKTELPLTVNDNNTKMTWSFFAKTVRQSKMYLCLNEINFSLGHRKGKIYEAGACGIMPLVTHPNVYNYKGNKCFIEGKHFVTINKSNYVDVIKYYVDNPEKRIEIAQELHNHYLEHFSERPFWYNIFKYAKDK